MKKQLTTGAIALSMALALSACGSNETPAPAANGGTSSTTPTSTTPAPSSTTPGTTPGTTPESSTPTASQTSSGTGTAPAVAIDQSTPEGAMTSWLGAMVGGKSADVCNLMASNGKPIASLDGASDACAKAIGPTLQQLSSLGQYFEGLSIKGATVEGENATFDAATTTPAMAASVIKNFKAVKIDSKWYITQ